MSRLQYDGVVAQLASAMDNVTTTITFASTLTRSGGIPLPTIDSGDYLPMSILDPTQRLSEIVWLTAYTAGTTTATVRRAMEQTGAVNHPAGVIVDNAPTVYDFSGLDTWHTVGATGEAQLLGNWVQSQGVHQRGQYRRTLAGDSKMRGYLSANDPVGNLSNIAFGLDGNAMFQLPSLYRPKSTRGFTVQTYVVNVGGGVAYDGPTGSVVIENDGSVRGRTHIDHSNVGVNQMLLISLDGIRFETD